MRIRRPNLVMPHPVTLMALAMIWPIYAIILTAATAPTSHQSLDQEPSKSVVVLQVVGGQADKFWRQVTLVPERIRAHLHSNRAS
jgi:hypothetical protein